MLSACSPTRRLGEGERFLERVEVTAPDGTKHANEGAFEEVLRQQPNTRLFGIRLPLQIHLMVRPEALENAQQKRLEKGKEEGGWRWWLANRMGEPPVTYDAYLAERSRLNLAALAQQMGYLDAACTLQIDTTEKQRARLAYALDLGKMWTVHSCSWATEGSGLKTDRLDFDPAALVGEPFDVRALENIRSNVASSFRNSGFPSVQASHVAFVADTLGMSKDKKVAVIVELLPVDYTADGAPIPHEVTRFGRIDWSCKERENGKVPCIADNVVDFLLAVDSGMLFNERVLQDLSLIHI